MADKEAASNSSMYRN